MKVTKPPLVPFSPRCGCSRLLGKNDKPRETAPPPFKASGPRHFRLLREFREALAMAQADVIEEMPVSGQDRGAGVLRQFVKSRFAPDARSVRVSHRP